MVDAPGRCTLGREGRVARVALLAFVHDAISAAWLLACRAALQYKAHTARARVCVSDVQVLLALHRHAVLRAHCVRLVRVMASCVALLVPPGLEPTVATLST
jgi:hypothetical protein